MRRSHTFLFCLVAVLPNERLLSQQAPPSASDAACPAVHGTVADVLERERLADYDSRRQMPSRIGWVELGCGRLFLDSIGTRSTLGLVMPLGVSWHQGSINALLRALALDSLAADALNPLATAILRDWFTDSLAPAGVALLRGARAGQGGPTVYVACAIAAFRMKNNDAAGECARDGLRLGHDSSYHHLVLARVAAMAADTAAARRAFDAAVGSARTEVDRETVRWQLQWFLTPAEVQAIDAKGDTTGFVAKTRTALAIRDVRDGHSAGGRLVEHFHRLAYAEEHFSIETPRRLRERLRTLPATVIFPSDLLDSLREARIRGRKARDLYDPNDPIPHSVPALPFREYNRWQSELDDRGTVYLRFGAPKLRIPRFAPYTARELWVYVVDGAEFLVNFESEAFTGSQEATRLVAGVVGDYFCDVSALRCDDYQRAMGNRLAPERLNTRRVQDRAVIALTTTRDNSAPEAKRRIQLVASAYSIWDPASREPVTLFTYALPLRDLGRLPGDTLLPPVTLRLQALDGAGGDVRDSALTRAWQVDAGGAGNRYLSGVVAMAGPASLTAWSVFATQGAERGGRYFREVAALSTGGPLTVSDLILGMRSEGLIYRPAGTAIPLAALQAFPRTEPTTLYFQVRAAPSVTGSVNVSISIAHPAERGRPAREVLAVRSGLTLREGVNEVLRELDFSRIAPGSYDLVVTIRHSATGRSDSRRTALYVR